MIHLIDDNIITNNEKNELINWLQNTNHLTKGELTKKLEKQFAKWLGGKYSLFVNSGSSANLLMIYTLICLNKLKNKKVIIPTLSWNTTISPIIQFGLTPILCDCNYNDLTIDIKKLEILFKEQEPSVLLLVNPLGIPADMNKIIKLCNQYDVILLEDSCETMGSYNRKNKMVGTFGLMNSFSTFIGHTITTIEGGFVSTNDKNIYHTLLMLRSHGWDRDLPKNIQNKLQKKYNIDDFNKKYTFYEAGFNLRNTDIGAFIGLQQLKKLNYICKKRYENYLIYKNIFKNINELKLNNDSFISNFAFPLVLESKEKRNEIIKKLNKKVECRPIISGCMNYQPFLQNKLDIIYDISNAKKIHDCGLYLPNNPSISNKKIQYIYNLIK